MNIQEWIKTFRDLWKLMKKPSKEEIKQTLIVTLALVVIIGFVGWIIQEVINFLLMIY